MNKVDPLFAYLSVLSVIQPARIQDIEMFSVNLLDEELARWMLDKGLFRTAHEDARHHKMVIDVKRGVYFMTPKGKQIVRRAGLERSIDNRRLFLMKEQRRRYK